MGIVSTILRFVGGFVGQRLGSSVGSRLEGALLAGNREDASDEEDDEGDQDETDSDDAESGDGEDGEEAEDNEEAETEESGDDSESADDESTGPPVIEQVTAALDSIGDDSEESNSGLGDLDALSDEELEELAGTLVDELNQRSEQ